MRRALAVAVFLIAACSGGPTRVPTPPPIVPWIDAPFPTPPPQPAPTPLALPVPAGTPSCAASQLTLAPGLGNGAGGVLFYTLLIGNRGPQPCHLSGLPTIRLRTASGVLKAPIKPMVEGNAVVDVLLSPGITATAEPRAGEAALTLALNSRPEYPGCSAQAITLTAIDIPLPDGSTFTGPLSGVGGACLEQTGVQVSPFQSTLPMLPAQPTPTPAPRLVAAIEPPRAVRPGERLTYIVDLTNVSGEALDLGFPYCPGYSQGLRGPVAFGKDLHALNCAEAGIIQLGVVRRFQMQTVVPASVPPGAYTLYWDLVVPGSFPEAQATAKVSVLRS